MGDSECVDSNSFEDDRPGAGCRVAVFGIVAISRRRVGEQRLVEPLQRAIADILDRDLAVTRRAAHPLWERLVPRSGTSRSSSSANYLLGSSCPLKLDEGLGYVVGAF